MKFCFRLWHHTGLTSRSEWLQKSKVKEQEVKDQSIDLENKTEKQNCHPTNNNPNAAQTVAMVVAALSSGEQHFCWPSEVCPWVGLTGGGDVVSENVSACQACNSYDPKSFDNSVKQQVLTARYNLRSPLGYNKSKDMLPSRKESWFIFSFDFILRRTTDGEPGHMAWWQASEAQYQRKSKKTVELLV